MKNTIKNTLTDLLEFAEFVSETVLFKNAQEEIGHEDFSIRMRRILRWQKDIFNDALVGDEEFKDKMILWDVERADYEKIFSLAPEIKEIFKLNGNQIEYNSALTEEEIKEIQKMIGENLSRGKLWINIGKPK